MARATRLPIVLYNVPGRTASNTPVEVYERLDGVSNIVAVKEASGNLEQAAAIRARTRLTLLSGDDGLTLPMIAVGAEGVISVAGNVAPEPMRALTDHARAGRLAEAQRYHHALTPLIRALFVESNPGPAKAQLAAMGILSNELRLPLVPVETSTEKQLAAAMESLRRATAEAVSGRAGR